ncbi:pentatricopeptide repeat-containing protein At3g16610-like [Typha angustifolia]|uniref:pentatricopeptide repeat-containing protein At3g16610-like n=1 Tax=Typha angustifolia TaxID=59011 RepID=UPI003C2DEF18
MAASIPLPLSPITQHPRTAYLHAHGDRHKTNTLSSNQQSLLKSRTLPLPTPSTQRNRTLLLNDTSDYASAIDSCDCPFFGRQIHAHAFKRGFCGCREFLETRILIMYGRCSTVEVARLLFDKMPHRTMYSWVGILTVIVDHGFLEEAIFVFLELISVEVELEFFIFPVALKACGGLGSLELGKALHGFVLKKGFDSNLYVGNALIDMYGKCGFVDEAIRVLEGMPETDCVSWNSVINGCAANGMVFEALKVLESMQQSDAVKPNLVSWSAAIGGFAQNGYDKEALELLGRMIDSSINPNAQTLAVVLPACGRLELLNIGKEMHGYIVRHELMSNAFIVNGLVDVYRRCNHMIAAEVLFLRFSVRNLVSYNTMLVGYCENNELEKAKELFDCMELDGVKRDAISWNSMISGFVDNEKFDEALEMFSYMNKEKGIESDSFNLGSSLSACSALGRLRQGKEIHSYAIARGLHTNPFVGAALVELYSQSQDLFAAELAFGGITERNTVTWNMLISGFAQAGKLSRSLELLALMREDGFEPNIYTWNGMIAGCMENGQNELALHMFCRLQSEMLRPDIYTIGMILPICSRLVSIVRGKQVHAYSIRCGYDSDVHIGAALVDMYCKCGDIRLGILSFHRIWKHNLVSYNTMLAGFAMHGLGEEGLALFSQLIQYGIRPDEITFLSVLSSCVHGGVVEEGHFYFNLMTCYDIKPDLKHYTCMVDLLSRAGQLNEAYELIQNMPMTPDAVVWAALLSGCVTHCNVQLGEIAANRLFELEEGNVANYILLANLYALAGRWDDLTRTRHIIKDKRMHKSPGCSWIEVHDKIHLFLAGDKSHRQTSKVYATLESLNYHMTRHDEMAEIA